MMNLSKILEKIAEKYPDDEDVDMALTISMEKGAEDEELGLEEDEDILPFSSEEGYEDEDEIDMEEDEDLEDLDVMMGIPNKKKKKQKSKEMY